MAKDFYSSDAVNHPIPEQHFEDTFDELMRSDVYVEAYIMECGGAVAGYALLAKIFAQEAGGMALWLDELYIKPAYRSRGLGHEFFEYLERRCRGSIKRLRLEVERGNRKAVSLYRELGFRDWPYFQMAKDL